LICMYLRKSRADAEAESRGEGETLARHEKALMDLAKKQKLNVTTIYKEIVSGETIASRPVMQRLLSEVEQGVWSAVLVMEVERLARGDTIDQGIVAQAFKYSSTKIITPNKTYDPSNEFDEEYFEFGLFMSRREYKTINRRLQRGRLASVREGKYCANNPPYGYVRKKLEREKGFTLEQHPDQAPVVKMIFDMYTSDTERIGVSRICNHLNGLGIPASKGVWVTPSVRDILRNPVYAGKIRWNSRPAKKKIVDGQVKIERPRAKDVVLVDGLHPAIVTEELYEKAQYYLSQNPSNPCPKEMKIQNPLAGIMFCGECGRRMVRRPYNGREQAPTLMCPLPKCKTVSTPLHMVEDTLVSILAGWKIDVERVESSKDVSVDPDIIIKVMEKLENEIEVLKKQLNNAHDFLEQGIYDTQTFVERSKIVADKIKAAEQQHKELKKELKKPKLEYEKIPAAVSNYYDLNIEEKNQVLKSILDKVVYRKEIKLIPDAFTLDVYPKTQL